MNSRFVHLHCHSEYSLLDGLVRINSLIKTCQDCQMNAVAITDNGVMFGLIDFYLKAKQNGINPIMGCEMYLTGDISRKERSFDRLILLCKDQEGYQNLVELVTIANLQGFYYRPRIDLLHLSKHASGLIAISPGYNGPVADSFRKNEKEEGREKAFALQQIFPDFYLGIQRLGMPMEELIVDLTCEVSKELAIPIVATNDVYYLGAQDASLREVLSCIQMGKTLDDDNRRRFLSNEMYFKSAEEMEALFKDHPEAIENTVQIAQKCHFEIETEQVKLPHFECPEGLSNQDFLKKLVFEGIARRYDAVTDEIQSRLDFELKTINSMGYAPYFLIIYDFLNYARQQEIPVGPGRGSAAGSIVAYALDITNIDPLKYGLLFERFLNPDRVSMPDIDLDFCIKRRNEIIDYISQKYGTSNVSQIVTFGTMAARGVVRDVGRVLGVMLSEVDRIAKLIPSTPGHQMSIPEAIESVPELKNMYEKSSEVKRLLDIGSQLEGLSRHTSTHAAGIVISAEPLSRTVPLIRNEGQATTQYPMTELEKIGLLKMDILGLRNLTVISDALKAIKQYRGIDIDLNSIPLDDPKTYKLLCDGKGVGVFQLESRGMRQLMKDLTPQVFEDIIALLALYRPGPLGSGMVNDFISNKSGKTQVKYVFEELEPILKDTYGLIVYQEQVMQIASVIGGFSLGQADLFRKAMGKKKKEVMDEMKTDFVQGAEKKGFDTKEAEALFNLCYKFAEYGFNKSHSAAYAFISYQTAYLKANYTIEYLTALLSSVLFSSDKTTLYIEECRQFDIQVLPPDVNASFFNFSISGNNIRYGLGAVKNVGEGAIESIIKNRSEQKLYKSLMDFCLRVDLKQVNKRVIESLIKSGAFDSLGLRETHLSVFERVLERAQVLNRERSNGQISLFSIPNLEKSFSEDDLKFETLSQGTLSHTDKLKMEKEMLGLYISGHPLDKIRDKLESMPFNTEKLTIQDENKMISIAGILSNCRKIVNKNKREMILATLSDLYGDLPVLLFQGKRFNELIPHFIDDNIVIIKGKVRISQDEISLMCEDLSLLDYERYVKKFHIDASHLSDEKVYSQIQEICSKFQGEFPLYFHVDQKIILAHQKYWIGSDELGITQIENLVGTNHIWSS